jgi:hypothetical protein
MKSASGRSRAIFPNAVLISRPVVAFCTAICSRIARAACCVSLTAISVLTALTGLTSRLMRAAVGRSSRSSPSRLATNSLAKKLMPVTLRPRRPPRALAEHPGRLAHHRGGGALSARPWWPTGCSGHRRDYPGIAGMAINSRRSTNCLTAIRRRLIGLPTPRRPGASVAAPSSALLKNGFAPYGIVSTQTADWTPKFV